MTDTNDIQEAIIIAWDMTVRDISSTDDTYVYEKDKPFTPSQQAYLDWQKERGYTQ